MPDVWLPGAHRDLGRNAGYNAGRSQMRRAVAHYTVGSDSRGVGRNGYFHFLVHRDASRENGCTQYAEVDAVTWHAADAGNPYGPGVEWERLVTGGINDEGLSDAEPLTPNQLAWGARLITFFAEWGIPAQLYSGPRYQQQDWDGWVNHQAIDSQRSDGLLVAEFAAMVAPPEEEDVNADQDARLKNVEKGLGGVIAQFGPQGSIEDVKSRLAALGKKIDGLPAGGGGGLSEAQVRAVIRDELNKTKLAG